MIKKRKQYSKNKGKKSREQKLSKKRGGKQSIYKTNRNKSASEWIRSVLNFFALRKETSFPLSEVQKAIRAKSSSELALTKQVVESLYQQKRLSKDKQGSYFMPRSANTFQAVFQYEAGQGFVIPKDGDNPILIADNRNMGARSGDRVEVETLSKRKGTTYGEVITIIQHAKEDFVGVVTQVFKNTSLVSSNDKGLGSGEVIVLNDENLHLKKGDKVTLRITDWGENKSKSLPIGEITAVLGKQGENDTEMHAILAEFGLPYSYPQACEDAANAIPENISEEEIRQREDFRSVPTFTIDPEDAKDFDDALSLRHLANGNIEVGVHIADVTHYVTPGSLIDKEAYERATSVYLVDRTVPMLPERLCNDLCSLRPELDRLAFSVIFELSSIAEVVNARVIRTVINSDRRFTYEEAQRRIDKGEGDRAEEIVLLHSLAQMLRKRRFEKGGVRFESQELRFVLDDKGFPIDVTPEEHGTAHELIEEFMLLANKTVAELIGKKKTPNDTPKSFVYRIHADPDPEKLSSAKDFLQKSKIIKVNSSSRKEGKITTKEINRLFDQSQNTPFESVVSMLLLRAMARAEYSTQNIGHYGLAFPFYTHFTSPIRRYPDIMVHRLLTRYLFEKEESVKEEELEEKCMHCSERERVADNADRASVKYKQAEYLENQKNKVFDGYITGVTEWGLYVTLKHSGCEGLLPIRLLEDDYYRFDEDNYCLVGSRYRRKYVLGQPLRIRVADVDKIRRLIDFELVE